MIKTACLLALGFASALVFIRSTTPFAQEPQAIRESPANEGDDDIKPNPHPQWYWYRKTEDWIARGEPHELRPVAPAQRVKTPCRLYNQNPQREGDGIIRRLSPVDVYPEECERLRRVAR